MLHDVALAQQVQGERDFVPNGSFEQLTIDHEQQYDLTGRYYWPFWPERYAYRSRWWRQFHREFQANSVKPPAIIEYYEDRVPYVMQTGKFYDPVSCSTTDLFTSEQEPCEQSGARPLFGIPENWFGNEPARLRPDAFNRRYAGLYYRLNGVQKLSNGGTLPITLLKVPNPATELWREYLEVELLCHLQAGQTYTLSYYASLAEVSTHALKLEARLSQEPYRTLPSEQCAAIPDDDGPDAKVGIPYTTGDPGLILQSDPIIQKNGWKELKYTFVAKGEERYLTIGNFEMRPGAEESRPRLSDCRPAWYSNPNATEIAYYYIDDVRLTQTVNCFCMENNQAFRAKLVPKESQDPSKCCYSIQLSNGGTSDCHYSACSIYGVDLLDVKSNGNSSDVLFSWKSNDLSSTNPMREPVTADTLWHELGTLCVPTFTNLERRELTVAVKGQSGTTFCKERISYTGCLDKCGCEAFSESVVVRLLDKESKDKCCFEVSIDASKLTGGCAIHSVDVYDGSDRITDTYTPATPVGKDFTGPLYTFCLDRSENTNGMREIVFRDASGNIICRKTIELRCECDCNKRPPKVEIDFLEEKWGSGIGKCCYKVVVRQPTTCGYTINSLEIGTDESLTVSSGNWTTSRSGNSLILTPVKGRGWRGSEDTIGVMCVSACMGFDPRALNITASVSMNNNEFKGECQVPVTVNNKNPKLCWGAKSCDDVVLTLVKGDRPKYPTVDDCCRKVRVQIRGCTIMNKSLDIDIKGPNGIPLKTTNLGGGVFESAYLCRSYRDYEIFTVVVRDIRGTILCTKTISVPSCQTPENNQ